MAFPIALIAEIAPSILGSSKGSEYTGGRAVNPYDKSNNLIIWGIVAFVLIVIVLVLVMIFKRKK